MWNNFDFNFNFVEWSAVIIGCMVVVYVLGCCFVDFFAVGEDN